MEKITSKSNQIIKDTKKLLTSSKFRTQCNAFVLEGARLSFDVLNSVYKIRLILITESVYERYRESADKIIEKADNAYFISSEVADKLSETASSQGIFVVCEMKSIASELGSKVIALDNIQDPSNLGALVRTAEALGIDSIIAYKCCDIYNSKALRASMGSILRMSIVRTDNLEEMLSELKNRYRIYSTVPLSTAVAITDIDFSLPSICVIGNEANGVEDNIKAVSDELITIPMLGRAESLNASVAGAITMWEMLR